MKLLKTLEHFVTEFLHVIHEDNFCWEVNDLTLFFLLCLLLDELITLNYMILEQYHLMITSFKCH